MSEYIAHTETVRGYKLEIIADNDPQHSNPRDYDQLGIMLCEHSRYTLGDGDETGGVLGPVDVDAFKQALERFAERRNGVRAFVRWLKVYHGTTVVLPLYLYDHSGITISAGPNMVTKADPDPMSRRNRFMGDGAGWDTSTVGFIFDTAKTRELTGAPIESIETQLQDEVKEYALYLEGSVYGYVITDADDDEVESCWGYLSESDGHVLEEARHAVPDTPAEEAAAAKRQEAEAAEQAEREAIATALSDAGADAVELFTSVLAEAPLSWLRSWAATHTTDTDTDTKEN